MFEKQKVVLKMSRSYLPGEEADGETFTGAVLACEPEKNYLRLALGEEEVLPKISLDALYTCAILEEDAELDCEIVIKERYINHHGGVLETQLKNGFMKKI